MADSIYWAVIWTVLTVAIWMAAVLAGRSRRAMYIGRAATATLFIAAGGLFNALNLATGADYANFADDSYVAFVRDTWRSVVAPNQYVFIPLLVAFEVTVGVLVLAGGRRTRLGLMGAIGFEVGLVFFGWAFAAWSIPTIVAFALLLRAERKRAAAPVAAEAQRPQRLAA